MDLSQLRYFVCIAKNLSFTRAAEELHVTQPTISKQISSLERELGVKLFHRSNQATSLTECGQRLYPQFKSALATIDAAVASVATGGTVRIGVRDMMDINHVLPGFIAAFTAAHPDIAVSIAGASSDVLMRRLDRGRFDIIFMGNQQTAVTDARKQCILYVSKTHTYLYYSAGFPLPDGEPTLDAFLGRPLIIYPSRATLAFYEQLAKDPGVTFRNVIRAESTENLIISVESGLAYCIMGRSFSRLTSNPDINALDLTETAGFPHSGMVAIWNRDNTSAALRTFVRSLRESCRI